MNGISHDYRQDIVKHIKIKAIILQLSGDRLYNKKQVSMIRIYHIHTQQTNPRHREEGSQNTKSHNTSGKQSAHSSLSR